jgi:hypothetical protein
MSILGPKQATFYHERALPQASRSVVLFRLQATGVCPPTQVCTETVYDEHPSGSRLSS